MAHLLLLAGALVGELLVYLVGLAVLVTPGIMLLTRAIEIAGAVWFWPIVAMTIAYGVMACWGGWKAHRALRRWLD